MKACWNRRGVRILMQVLHGPCPASIESYIQAGIAGSTRRAYRSKLNHFHSSGRGIPATDSAAHLAEHAEVYSVPTLQRRLAGIPVAHEAFILSDELA